MNFERVLQKVLWRLVTEGSISYRRVKLSFGLDNDGLEELRRELIVIKRVAADLDGEVLVWVPDGRAARPEPLPLPQPLRALGQVEKPTILAAERDLPVAGPVWTAPGSDRRGCRYARIGEDFRRQLRRPVGEELHFPAPR